MMNFPRFHRWSCRVGANEQHLVFPDGCRDVLIIREPRGVVRTILTQFDFRPRVADLRAGSTVCGYRLRPGAVISAGALDAIAASPGRVATILGDDCGGWNDLDETIVKLGSPGVTVRGICREAGVSVRTMQRYFQSRNLPAPDYWRLLARARRAAGLLSSMALADIAGECGFSDQAHMTRDLARWFGFSPAQLRLRRSILDILRQPALGNWTGEQISTR